MFFENNYKEKHEEPIKKQGDIQLTIENKKVEEISNIENENKKHYAIGMSINFETDVAEDEYCNTWYYLDDMKEYLDVKPDTINRLEQMIKTIVIK